MINRGKLTRYIAMRFAMAISGMFLLFLILIYMIDFVEILRLSTKFGGTPFFQMAWITFLRMPSFAEICFPFAVLAGSIASFLLLSRSSELIVIRASGMSVWQFVWPGIFVAFIFGLIAVCLYNPLAARAKAQSEILFAKLINSKENVFRSKHGNAWLRQDSIDGQSIISAKNVTDRGRTLTGVIIVQYDKKHSFFERIEGQKASLQNGYWRVSNAWVSRVGEEPAFYNTFLLSTNLSPTQVIDALASANSVSFWQLPRFIEVAENAGLSATRFKVQYQLLLSRPLVLISMVLLAATCSLKGFRFGNIQIMVIGGLFAGFIYFMVAEVSRNMGLSGITAPFVAAWTPVFIACCLTITVLLYQEDG